LPVVATGTGGALEIILDGVTGKLVPVNDVQAMAEALCALLRNEEGRRRMGEQGRMRAREFFSLERMVSKTEALYREVLDAK
jgi:D-inositol-3-phosphate glycosyltransferase